MGTIIGPRHRDWRPSLDTAKLAIDANCMLMTRLQVRAMICSGSVLEASFCSEVNMRLFFVT